jgi:hypothetical protein
MEKVFVEYAIADESRDEYIAFMKTIRARGAEWDWFEGTDQPGLFVEVWHGVGYAEYEAMKRSRTDPGDEEWGKMLTWVRGGTGKLHLWHFTGK